MGLFNFLKGKDGKNGKDASPCVCCKDSLEVVMKDIPRSSCKDFKTDASDFIQACINDPFISKIPAGFYYYTKPSILHSQIIDMQGCVFYTDKDVSFMIVRGNRPTITGYPFIDVISVKEPTGKGVIS